MHYDARGQGNPRAVHRAQKSRRRIDSKRAHAVPVLQAREEEGAVRRDAQLPWCLATRWDALHKAEPLVFEGKAYDGIDQARRGVQETPVAPPHHIARPLAIVERGKRARPIA